MAILMMSTKLATVGLLKIKIFWNKGYDVILSANDVTNKILSRDPSYIVDAVMSAKLATVGLLKINIFWNKGYDVILSANDVTKKLYHVTQVIMWTWSYDHILVTLAFLWENRYHNLNFIKVWPGKPVFLRGAIGLSSIILGWH